MKDKGEYWSEWDRKIKDYEHNKESAEDAKEKGVEYHKDQHEAFRR